MRKRIVATVFLAVTSACTGVPSVVGDQCNPEAAFPEPGCEPDAGTDADASDDAPDAETQAACTGRCVPEPSSESAGDWPRTPMLLWFGPRELAPANCDEARKLGGYGEDVELFEKYRRF